MFGGKLFTLTNGERVGADIDAEYVYFLTTVRNTDHRFSFIESVLFQRVLATSRNVLAIPELDAQGNMASRFINPVPNELWSVSEYDVAYAMMLSSEIFLVSSIGA